MRVTDSPALTLVKSGQAKRRDSVPFACAKCGCTITVRAKVGGVVVKGKRSMATQMDVCANCLVAGRLSQ